MIADRKRCGPTRKSKRLELKNTTFSPGIRIYYFTLYRYTCLFFFYSAHILQAQNTEQTCPINAPTNFLPSETGAISYIVLQTQHDINNYVRHQKKNVFKHIYIYIYI